MCLIWLQMYSFSTMRNNPFLPISRFLQKKWEKFAVWRNNYVTLYHDYIKRT